MIDAPASDALGGALRFIRLSGIFYCPSELTEPWGLSLPPMPDCLWFHVVTSGAATIDVGDGPPVMIRSGDLVVVPHGTGHRAWGAAPAPTPSVLDLPHEYLSERYAVLRTEVVGTARTSCAAACGSTTPRPVASSRRSLRSSTSRARASFVPTGCMPPSA